MSIKFHDCANCLHEPCCGGPQYGCKPAYTDEHYEDEDDDGIIDRLEDKEVE